MDLLDAMILSWRSLRKTIITQSPLQACETVAIWCGKLPLNPHGLDCYDYDLWINPWQLFESGDFNRNTVAYLMHQTFELSDATYLKSKLILLQDLTPASNDIYWTVFVNDTYVLNYEIGAVSLLPVIENNIEVKMQYMQK